MARGEPSHSDSGTDPLTAPRDYLRVRPTTDAIHPQQVSQALTKLHALPAAADGGRFRSPVPPTVEMLLVTPANSQRIDYLFGIAGGELDALERVLDVWFPNSYERSRTSTTLETALTRQAAATANAAPLADRSVAGLELHADERTPGDWRTRLTPFADFHEPDATDTATWPLGAVLTALARTDAPVVVQTLLEPLPDWSTQRDERIYELRTDAGGTVVDTLLDSLDSRPPQERDRPDRGALPPDIQTEIEELQAAMPRRSLAINTRAIAAPTPEQPVDPAAALADLGEAFAAVGHTGYQLSATRYPTDSDAARRLADDLTARTLRDEQRGSRLPAAVPVVGSTLNSRNPRIVAAPDTAGAFCAVGGASLPEPARRAIQTKSRDSVPRPLPPTDVLDHYRTAGFRFGRPQSTNSTSVGDPLALPPSLQRRHCAILGQTGWGKGMLAITGLLSNHTATDGATIIVETKDGQFADDYLRAHYAEYETLDDVYRFDAHERLPAAPIFDIEPAMASGLSRTQAVQAVTNQLEAMLRGVMGTEAYEAATTSSRVIRALVKALFDPVHGDTQFTLVDLQETLARMQRTESAPPVANEQLRRTLSEIVANSQDTFTEIVRAAGRRLDELAAHEQLAPQFTYTADSPTATATVDRFDWRAKLDEDCVIIIDSSALDADPQRVLTLLTLSQLWTALRRRRRERRAADADGDPPLVNIHIEEAADVAASGVLDTLLSKGRSFGVGVSLSMQFLKQLDHVDPEAYAEAVNNTGTVIAGQTNRDRALAERLATSDCPPEQVANRLRALDAGEWLCSLPAAFDGGNPAPFTIASGPLPPGHPDGPAPLSEARAVTFDAAAAKLEARTRAYGLPVADSEPASTTEATPDETAAATTSASEPSPNAGRPTLDTTGPFTSVTPEGVEFDAERNDWCCTACGNSYGSSLEKLLQAVDCHGDRTDVARDRIPTLEVDCSLTRAERDRSPYDDAQLVFMQLLYNVRVGSYDRDHEFDLVWDDMDRLVAYAGLADDQLAELITDGLVVQDTTRPQTIYSLTADGRAAINVAHREGVVHGEGKGDLSESNFHVMLVETLTRVLRRQYVNAPDQPGVTVEPYYGVADGRLDVAVLDRDDNVVVAAEAERSNNDTLRAVPDDYDKMAACTPDEAIWLVPNRRVGHEVKRALCNPPDGQPRLPDRYADSTRLAHMDYDEPGLTELVGVQSLRDSHLDGHN